MDAERAPQQANPAPEMNSYLYEKLTDAFEQLIERVVDEFTYSRFIEFNKQPLSEYYDRNVVENFIHQLRQTIRQDFKTVYLDACMQFGLRETLNKLTMDIEKAKILREFEEVTGNLFTQGPEYYFEFLNGVLKKLKETNAEVPSSPNPR